MLSDQSEVVVTGQHRQAVADAELSKQGINRAHLHTSAPAIVAQSSRFDVVLPCNSALRRQPMAASQGADELADRDRHQRAEGGGHEPVQRVQRLGHAAQR